MVAWDIALAPEPGIFSMPKTFELTNLPFTVPQFILKTKNSVKKNRFNQAT